MTSPIYLTDSNFSTGDNIHHRYFTRRGGVSKGIYESLNVGLGSNDINADILENRRLICADLGIPESNLLTLYQVHSTDCLYVTSPFWRIPSSLRWHGHRPPQPSLRHIDGRLLPHPIFRLPFEHHRRLPFGLAGGIRQHRLRDCRSNGEQGFQTREHPSLIRSHDHAKKL